MVIAEIAETVETAVAATAVVIAEAVATVAATAEVVSTVMVVATVAGITARRNQSNLKARLALSKARCSTNNKRTDIKQKTLQEFSAAFFLC